MKGKVALIIVFTHRFDRNIPILESIYRDRFSHVYHLVPFYDGDRENVIPVYENSYYYHGYLAQGFKHYFKEQFEHYFFVADDMVLNPAINEENYKDFFKVNEDTGFVPEIFTPDNFTNDNTLLFSPYYSLKDRFREKLLKQKAKPSRYFWWRIVQALQYDPKKEGVEALNEIPSFDDALQIFQKHGVKVKPLVYADLHYGCPTPNTPKKFVQFIRYIFNQHVIRKKYPLKYPLVASYSDILIVPAGSIRKFVHYCGVFAATELFVEYAVPTALLLATDKVVCEPHLSKRGLIYWPYTEAQKELYQKEMDKFHFRIDNLLANFPEETLYIHPIKLSKWKPEKV
jgi:hypothetical protein